MELMSEECRLMGPESAGQGMIPAGCTWTYMHAIRACQGQGMELMREECRLFGAREVPGRRTLVGKGTDLTKPMEMLWHAA